MEVTSSERECLTVTVCGTIDTWTESGAGRSLEKMDSMCDAQVGQCRLEMRKVVCISRPPKGFRRPRYFIFEL